MAYEDLIDLLLPRIVQAESAGNPNAVSPAGAAGLTQLMPDTARRFGVSDRFDPQQSLQGARDYLGFLADRYQGDPELMVMAYHAGEGNVDKYLAGQRSGVGPKTLAYRDQVLGGIGDTPQDAPTATSGPGEYYNALFADLRTMPFTPLPEAAPARGTLGYIGHQAVGGAVSDAPRLIGQGLKALSEPGATLYEAGKGLVAGAEARAPAYAPEEDRTAVVKALGGGARMLTGVAPAIGAGVAGAAAAGWAGLPAAVGLGVEAALTGGAFGLSSWQDTFEAARQAGRSESEARAAADYNALLQGALGAVGGGIAGRAVSGVARPLLGAAPKSASEALAQLTAPTVVGPAARQALESGIAGMGVGMGMAAGGAAIEQSYGIPGPSPAEAAWDMLGPATGAAVLGAPLASIGALRRARALNAHAQALSSPATAPGERLAIANLYAGAIEKADPQAAQTFAQNVVADIQAGKPITLADSLFQVRKPGTVDLQAAQAASPTGTIDLLAATPSAEPSAATPPAATPSATPLAPSPFVQRGVENLSPLPTVAPLVGEPVRPAPLGGRASGAERLTPEVFVQPGVAMGPEVTAPFRAPPREVVPETPLGRVAPAVAGNPFLGRGVAGEGGGLPAPVVDILQGPPHPVQREPVSTVGAPSAVAAARARVAEKIQAASRQGLPPVPENAASLPAQLDAFAQGRKPAVLVTPGSPFPDRLPAGARVAELAAGRLIYRDTATLDLARAGRLSEALGYGIEAKPASATVVTARDAQGRVVQDVSSDGRPEVIAAAERAAGPGGSVETRPLTQALAERTAPEEAIPHALQESQDAQLHGGVRPRLQAELRGLPPDERSAGIQSRGPEGGEAPPQGAQGQEVARQVPPPTPSQEPPHGQEERPSQAQALLDKSAPASMGAVVLAQRQENARRSFINDVKEQFGLSDDEANAALNTYLKEKLVRLDPVMGQFTLQDGRFWDASVLRRAAAQQTNAPPKPKRDLHRVDATRDTLLTAIAKLGGLNREEAAAQGIDPAEFRRRAGILPVFTHHGHSFDAMAEAVSQHGYGSEHYTANELLDLVDRELRGRPVYSSAAGDKALEAMAGPRSETEAVESGYNDLSIDERALSDARLAAVEQFGKERTNSIEEEAFFDPIDKDEHESTPAYIARKLWEAVHDARGSWLAPASARSDRPAPAHPSVPEPARGDLFGGASATQQAVHERRLDLERKQRRGAELAPAGPLFTEQGQADIEDLQGVKRQSALERPPPEPPPVASETPIETPAPTGVSASKARAPEAVQPSQAPAPPPATHAPEPAADLARYTVTMKGVELDAAGKPTGKTLHLQERADVALKEVEEQMSRMQALLECLGRA